MKKKLIVASLLSLVVGCSRQESPTGPDASALHTDDGITASRSGEATNPPVGTVELIDHIIIGDPFPTAGFLFPITLPDYDTVEGGTEVSQPISATLGGSIKLKTAYFKNGVKQLSISAQIKFPAGALDQDNIITIQLDPQTLAFEFLPHGLRFNVPVLLTIDTYGLDLTGFEQNTDLWYIENGRWVQSFQGGNIIINVPLGKLFVKDIPLPHFSRYGFGRIDE